MQLLAMGNTCPYMPTSFREFLKVAVDLGRAVEPTSTSTAGTEEDAPASRRPSSSAAEHPKQSLSPAQEPAGEANRRTPASGSREPSGLDSSDAPPAAEEGDDGKDGEGDGKGSPVWKLSRLPSFASRGRGVSRMISAPSLGLNDARGVMGNARSVSWDGGGKMGELAGVGGAAVRKGRSSFEGELPNQVGRPRRARW